MNPTLQLHLNPPTFHQLHHHHRCCGATYPSIYGGESCGLSGSPPRRQTYRNGRSIDISHQYHPNMPAFDSSDVVGQFLWLTQGMKNGSIANFSMLKLPIHTGTHVDAPGHVFDHYFDAGFDVDNVGRYWDVMKSLHIPRGVHRVLFRTLNTDRRLMFREKFDSSYVGFMKDGAQWLVDNADINLVGIDNLSVTAYEDLILSHLIFLQDAEVILVEGLELDNVPAGVYDVYCLPLRLLGAEGSPIRCILIK